MDIAIYLYLNKSKQAQYVSTWLWVRCSNQL